MASFNIGDTVAQIGTQREGTIRSFNKQNRAIARVAFPVEGGGTELKNLYITTLIKKN